MPIVEGGRLEVVRGRFAGSRKRSGGDHECKRGQALVLIIPLLWGCSFSLFEVAAEGGTAQEAALAQAIAKFDTLEAASIDLEKWQTFTNEHGALAWGTSYVLEAYLDMYETTRSRKYREKFNILADALLKRTDARRDLPDYKGRKRVGWGAVKYSNAGERAVWLVHTGMITYPLVRFAMIAGRAPIIGGFANDAKSLQELAEAALHEFNGQWRYDPVTQSGHYVYEDDEPHGDRFDSETPVPFNQQLAAGRSFIILWKLTGDSSYRQKAEGLARHFKEHLRVDSTGAYEWDYWYGKGLSHDRSREDISHGAIDVDFVVQAAQESIVFTRGDLASFSSAFFREIGVSRGGMLRDDNVAGRWLGLAEVECGVYRAVRPSLMARTGVQHPQVLLGVAKLVRYAMRCAVAQ